MNLNAKIYVAGHRGLVGSAIVRQLQQQGYNNLLLRTHAELDLLDAAGVEQFFAQHKPEYVFLAAAYVGGIMANNTYRADFIYRNLGIQQNVIGASFRHGVKKLLFLGSTCIYPKEAKQPIRESELLTAPLEYTNEPYAIAKIAGMKMCESFNLQYGTNYLSVMPTNLYGPNDNFDLVSSHVLPAMMRKMYMARCLYSHDEEALRHDLAKRPVEGCGAEVPYDQVVERLASQGITPTELQLWGSGRPLREFLYSDDMADACVFIMQHVEFDQLAAMGGSQVRNTHINIGTGAEVAIAELAYQIQRTVGYEGNITFDKSKPDGTMRKLTDVSRLHELGWHHQVDLAEGINRLYTHYLESLDD